MMPSLTAGPTLRHRRVAQVFASLLIAAVLAACSSAAAPPAAPTAAPAAAATVAATPTATATPTPLPTPNVAQVLVDNLAKLTKGSMDVSQTLTIAGVTVLSEGRYDFIGPARYLKLSIEDAQKTTSELTTAAGKTYLRVGERPWYADPTWSGSWGPDLTLIKAVTSTGVETRDGQALHRFVPTGATLRPDFCPFAVGPGTITVAIFAKDDGSPLIVECTLDGASLEGTMSFRLTAATPTAIPVADPLFTTFTSLQGYALDHPEGWDVESATKKDGWVTQHLLGPNGEWLCVISGPKGKDTLNSFAAGDVSYLKTEQKATISSNVAAKLGGERARVITYHYKDSSSGEQAYGVHVLAVHGSTEIVVLWESSADNEKADAVTFGYIRDSFTFTK